MINSKVSAHSQDLERAPASSDKAHGRLVKGTKRKLTSPALRAVETSEGSADLPQAPKKLKLKIKLGGLTIGLKGSSSISSTCPTEQQDEINLLGLPEDKWLPPALPQWKALRKAPHGLHGSVVEQQSRKADAIASKETVKENLSGTPAVQSPAASRILEEEQATSPSCKTDNEAYTRKLAAHRQHTPFTRPSSKVDTAEAAVDMQLNTCHPEKQLLSETSAKARRSHECKREEAGSYELGSGIANSSPLQPCQTYSAKEAEVKPCADSKAGTFRTKLQGSYGDIEVAEKQQQKRKCDPSPRLHDASIRASSSSDSDCSLSDAAADLHREPGEQCDDENSSAQGRYARGKEVEMNCRKRGRQERHHGLPSKDSEAVDQQECNEQHVSRQEGDQPRRRSRERIGSREELPADVADGRRDRDGRPGSDPGKVERRHRDKRLSPSAQAGTAQEPEPGELKEWGGAAGVSRAAEADGASGLPETQRKHGKATDESGCLSFVDAWRMIHSTAREGLGSGEDIDQLLATATAAKRGIESLARVFSLLGSLQRNLASGKPPDLAGVGLSPADLLLQSTNGRHTLENLVALMQESYLKYMQVCALWETLVRQGSSSRTRAKLADEGGMYPGTIALLRGVASDAKVCAAKPDACKLLRLLAERLTAVMHMRLLHVQRGKLQQDRSILLACKGAPNVDSFGRKPPAAVDTPGESFQRPSPTDSNASINTSEPSAPPPAAAPPPPLQRQTPAPPPSRRPASGTKQPPRPLPAPITLPRPAAPPAKAKPGSLRTATGSKAAARPAQKATAKPASASASNPAAKLGAKAARMPPPTGPGREDAWAVDWLPWEIPQDKVEHETRSWSLLGGAMTSSAQLRSHAEEISLLMAQPSPHVTQAAAMLSFLDIGLGMSNMPLLLQLSKQVLICISSVAAG